MTDKHDKEYNELIKMCEETPPNIDKISEHIQKALKNNNHKIKKYLAKGLYEQGKIDEAFEMLIGVPSDDEVRELHRALRYADEARGIIVY